MVVLKEVVLGKFEQEGYLAAKSGYESLSKKYGHTKFDGYDLYDEVERLNLETVANEDSQEWEQYWEGYGLYTADFK